jgi:hypothetical protein
LIAGSSNKEAASRPYTTKLTVRSICIDGSIWKLEKTMGEIAFMLGEWISPFHLQKGAEGAHHLQWVCAFGGEMHCCRPQMASA